MAVANEPLYSPTNPPPTSNANDPSLLWVRDELRRISRALTSIPRLQMALNTTAPPNPRTGMVVYADGTNWNPGSGEGVYEYTSGGVWVPMFTTSSSALMGSRNVKIVQASSTTLTATFDEVITEVTLGGASYKEVNGNHTLNIGTTGANGMDTGSAPTSGFLAIYSITKGDGSTFALLGQDCSTTPTSANLPGSIYPGSHMPAGYVASSLIGIWPTNGSAQVIGGLIVDRKFCYQLATFPFFKSNVTPGVPANTSVSSGVPRGARYATFGMGSSADHGSCFEFASDSNGTAAVFTQWFSGGAPFGTPVINGVTMFVHPSGGDLRIPITTSQQIYWGDPTNSGFTAMYAWTQTYEW